MGIDLALGENLVVLVGGNVTSASNVAQSFLQEAADVVLCGQSEPLDLPTATPIRCTRAPMSSYQPDDIASCLDQIRAEHGRLDVLVCLGSQGDQNAPSDSVAACRHGLIDYLHVNQAANRIMQSQAQGGCIINVVLELPAKNSVAAAAGLINLSSSLAVEWAPKVRVNAVTETTTGLGNTCLFLASHLSDYIAGAAVNR